MADGPISLGYSPQFLKAIKDEQYKREEINKLFTGLEPTAPIETLSNGGRQSQVSYRFDLIDPVAIFTLAQTLKNGLKKYDEDNWKLLPVKDHINHAIGHLYGYLMGDTSDNHLAHAFFRTMCAVALNGKGTPENPRD